MHSSTRTYIHELAHYHTLPFITKKGVLKRCSTLSYPLFHNIKESLNCSSLQQRRLGWNIVLQIFWGPPLRPSWRKCFLRCCRYCHRYFSQHFNRRLRQQLIGFSDRLRRLLWLLLVTLLRLSDTGCSERFIGLSKKNSVPVKNTLWKLYFEGSLTQAILDNSFLPFLLSNLPCLNSYSIAFLQRV